MWNLTAPLGFRGLDPHKPLRVYYRHLPHWRQDGATYFVTFRQMDSLPQNKLNELEAMKREWERKNPEPRSAELWDQLTRETMTKVEDWLDQGMGSCVLKHDWARKLLVDSMHHFDDDRYELDCHVVMPNHVHLLVRPLVPDKYPLEKILQSWKLYTSRRINAGLGRHGSLWQQESFDRIIRDEEHLYRSIQYIGRNPAKAGLANEECARWIRPAWEQLCWRFES